MGKQGLLGLWVGLVVLTGAACEAPLKPESQRARSVQDGAASASSAPSASPAPAAKPQSRNKTVKPSPTPPAIKVPKIRKPAPPPSGPILGADISWPQCPKGMGIPKKQGQGSPMPVAAARYVIIGLTNGPGFYPNPCLASQTDWVESRKLMAAAYSVISFPESRHLSAYGGKGPYDGGSRLGALSNVGYQQAKFNLSTMRRAGLRSPIIWLDVEPVPEYDWPADTTANAAVVRGAARGYRDEGFAIGVYSTQALWQLVVGDLRLGVAEWRAAGQTSREEALRRCGKDRMFQGGKPVLGQWVEIGRDMNITCPGISAQMGRWFHQY